MFLWLWHYLRGYVLIEVTGFSVERFINLAVHRGVYVWDVVYGEGSVFMKVSVKGFKMLKSCARKTKCHIRIAGKMGYPFVAHRYRKRKILAGGLFFFIAVLYFMSSFLWLIEVDGNDRVERDAILAYCSEQGVKPGSFKLRVDSKKLEKQLLNHFSELSWVSIHIKGTRAMVSVAETIPKQEIIDTSVPCNIVAKKDGLVTSIVTAAGTPMVRENDVVKKGDILVTGELDVIAEDQLLRKNYVRASAQVWAKMYTEINIGIPFTYTEKIYTGREKKVYSCIVMGKDINLIKYNTKFENYDKITARKQLSVGEDYPLPLIVVIEKYREYTVINKQRTIEQTKELAERTVTSRIIREFDFEADIVDIILSYGQNAESLDVKAIITTNERIDDIGELITEPDEQEVDSNGAAKDTA